MRFSTPDMYKKIKYPEINRGSPPRSVSIYALGGELMGTEARPNGFKNMRPRSLERKPTEEIPKKRKENQRTSRGKA
eukprot:9707011-Karenia_brevis.AAC.1